MNMNRQVLTLALTQVMPRSSSKVLKNAKNPWRRVMILGALSVLGGLKISCDISKAALIQDG